MSPNREFVSVNLRQWKAHNPANRSDDGNTRSHPYILIDSGWTEDIVQITDVERTRHQAQDLVFQLPNEGTSTQNQPTQSQSFSSWICGVVLVQKILAFDLNSWTSLCSICNDASKPWLLVMRVVSPCWLLLFLFAILNCCLHSDYLFKFVSWFLLRLVPSLAKQLSFKLWLNDSSNGTGANY